MIREEDIIWAAIRSVERLEERRNELKLTVVQLAEMASLNRTALWKILRQGTYTGSSLSHDIKTTTRLKLELALGFKPGGSMPSFEEILDHSRGGLGTGR